MGPGIERHSMGMPVLAEQGWDNETPLGVKNLLLRFFEAAWGEPDHFLFIIILIRPSLEHACPEIEQIPWPDIEKDPADYYDTFLYEFSIRLRHPSKLSNWEVYALVAELSMYSNIIRTSPFQFNPIDRADAGRGEEIEESASITPDVGMEEAMEVDAVATVTPISSPSRHSSRLDKKDTAGTTTPTTSPPRRSSRLSTKTQESKTKVDAIDVDAIENTDEKENAVSTTPTTSPRRRTSTRLSKGQADGAETPSPHRRSSRFSATVKSNGSDEVVALGANVEDEDEAVATSEEENNESGAEEREESGEAKLVKADDIVDENEGDENVVAQGDESSIGAEEGIDNSGSEKADKVERASDRSYVDSESNEPDESDESVAAEVAKKEKREKVSAVQVREKKAHADDVKAVDGDEDSSDESYMPGKPERSTSPTDSSGSETSEAPGGSRKKPHRSDTTPASPTTKKSGLKKKKNGEKTRNVSIPLKRKKAKSDSASSKKKKKSTQDK